MRKRQLDRGLQLLDAAESSVKALEETEPPGAHLSATLAAHRRTDPLTTALLRLDDARLRQIEAMQKLADSERRRQELEAMVTILEQRITVLEAERDRAREEVRAELQNELDLSREYRRQAGERLLQANHAVERARRLRLAADKQVAHEQHEVLRADSDSRGTSVLPPAPAGNLADELQLPPLYRIQEFLDANQEQMEELNQDLDYLDEELGLHTRQTPSNPHAETTVVWGEVIDSGESTEHLQQGGPDRHEEALPVTSGTFEPNNKTPSAQPKHFPDPTSSGGALSRRLVTNLSVANTPDALAEALTMLMRRGHVRSVQQLTSALPSGLRDDVVDLAVGRWIDGDALPDKWAHLEAVVMLLGATEDEARAFEQAYRRIAYRTSPSWRLLGNDLADLVPFTKWRRASARATPPRPSSGWMTHIIAPIVALVAAMTYASCLHASPTPHPWALVLYGIGALAVCLITIRLNARAAALKAQGQHAPPHKRLALTSLTVSVLAIPAGLLLPALSGPGSGGRWLAELIGLL
ncbi:hypothetical protein [Streptomyces sp. P9-2]|uniref:hypothetical protein n=1 Tax=Streptomyces sp. P9-2 TaxID=3423201 RepID=UPI003F747862